jgi:predicted neuraminidase
VRSHSDDSGKTWSDFLPTALPNPNSAIDGVRLPDRRVVVAYNDSEKHRYPLSLAVSADGGKTWRKLGDVVGEAGEYSYPAMVTSVSGGVHLAWTSNRRHIEYRYVPESFFK